MSYPARAETLLNAVYRHKSFVYEFVKEQQMEKHKDAEIKQLPIMGYLP